MTIMIIVIYYNNKNVKKVSLLVQKWECDNEMTTPDYDR